MKAGKFGILPIWMDEVIYFMKSLSQKVRNQNLGYPFEGLRSQKAAFLKQSLRTGLIKIYKIRKCFWICGKRQPGPVEILPHFPASSNLKA